MNRSANQGATVLLFYMRKIELELDEILELIAVADDYGFGDLKPDFARWIGSLSDIEIEDHASRFLSPEYAEKGYTEEDYDNVKERLELFREQFLK